MSVGDVIEVTMGDDNTATAVVIKNIGGAPGDSNSGEVEQGTSANTINRDSQVSGMTYTSDGDDENALRVTNASAMLDGVTVNKSGGASSNPGNGDFYGTNAALLATDGTTVISLTNNGTINFNGCTIPLAGGTVLR